MKVLVVFILLVSLTGCSWNSKTLKAQTSHLLPLANITLERERYFVISRRQRVGFRIDSQYQTSLFEPSIQEVMNHFFWQVTPLKESNDALIWISNRQNIDYIFIIETIESANIEAKQQDEQKQQSEDKKENEQATQPSLYPLRLKMVLYDAKKMTPLDVSYIEGYPSVFNRDLPPLLKKMLGRYFSKITIYSK